MCAQLRHHMLAMMADRVRRYTQHVGDLLLAVIFHHEAEDHMLGIGQRSEPVVGLLLPDIRDARRRRRMPVALVAARISE